MEADLQKNPKKNTVPWTPARLALFIGGLWLAVRLFTSLWAAVVSPLRPLTPVEIGVPLWPPGPGWPERVFLAPWQRWDAGWYVKIIDQGYRAGDGTAQFHPLYPWLATPLARLGLPPMLALLLVSSLSALFFLIVFYRLAALDLNESCANTECARTATLLLALCPVSLVLFAPYTESLFLWLAALCLWWSRQHRWGLAGLAGGLAVLTRQQGIFLLVPLLWEWWEASARSLPAARRNWRGLLGAALVPLGLLAWLFYRGIFLADVHPDFSSFHGMIYSVLISPDASQVVTVQAFLWPWQAAWIALAQVFTDPGADLVTNWLIAVYFLVILVWGWRGMRTSYRLYGVLIYWVSFSYHTGPTHPYMGLARHLLLAFPVFIGLGAVARRPWQRLVLVAVGVFGMAFALLEYVLEAWVL
ncbi:MAG: hypothetical protein ACOYYS_10425 [Chloroflexota bacterium]